jgi:carbonic anhydrase
MPNQLLDGYIRFKNGYLIEHKSELSLLAEEQRPRIAVVSCCDSRVDPTIIFDSRPGELFVIRNVANLVPLYNEEDKLKCTSSALEFAILGLNVNI